MAKRALVAIWDRLDSGSAGRFPASPAAVFLGGWEDVSTPRFQWGVNGAISSLTLDCARPYGAAREANEWGSDSSLACGNRADVWVSDNDTLKGNNPATWGKLIYRGTVEDYEWNITKDATRLRITIDSLRRLADQCKVTGTDVTPHGIITTYAPGLSWDSESATEPSIYPQNYPRQSVAQVLTRYAQKVSGDAVWFIRPGGSVKYFTQTKANTGTAGANNSKRHMLALGKEVFEPITLGKSTRRRASSVDVIYANGIYQTTAGSIYSQYDPRTVTVTSPTSDLTEAMNIASAVMSALDRVFLRAKVRVYDAGYDIESFEPGDVVRLHIPRPLPSDSSFAGSNDFNRNDLIIYNIDYQFDYVDLELEDSREDPIAFLQELKERLDMIDVVQSDINMQRASATLLATGATDMLRGTAGVVTYGKAGVISDSDFTSPQDRTIAIDETNSDIYVRVAGTWKKAHLT